MSQPPALAVEALACRRGERDVFGGVGFALGPGEALALGGRNGSGKSSLLRLLAGLTRPAAGRIAWQGDDIWQDIESHRARVALIGHLDAVKPAESVAENLGFWARLGGGAVAAALERFGLGHLAALPARYLSAGQRRRLALARLALSSAPLWLLDEPAVSLDAASVQSLAELIGQHRARGGMLALASHGDLTVADAKPLRLA
ncbi:MAG: heme ABC exporter ATP-binding protein CcmA [Alphaproteobacteria bacterium]|nr:heme ABC exporter ATP-binding protein CcmA [Alphaproteobacteria bacterium]